MAEIIGTMTNAGIALLNKVTQQGSQLTFLRGEFGDSMRNNAVVVPTAEQQVEFTSLINSRTTLAIADLSTQSGDATIELLVRNATVQTTYQVREVGLFAKDPDTNAAVLYCYIHHGDGGFILPASGNNVVLEFFYRIITAIGAASNVTAVIDRSSLYTTLERFLQHVDASDPHPNLTLPVASADSLGGVKIGNGLGMAHDAAANMILGNDDNTFIYLKPASATQRGGVKVGDGLSIDYDTLNLSTASTTQKGGVKVGSGLSMNGDSICAETYILPTASTTQKGGIIVGEGLYINVGYLSVKRASTTERGAIIVGNGLAMDGDTLNVKLYNSTISAENSSINATADSIYASNASLQLSHSYIGAGFSTIGAGFSSLNVDISTIKASSSRIDAVGATIAGNPVFVDTPVFNNPVTNIPTASATQKGGIKVGTGLSMNGDTLNCTITGGGGGSVPSDVAASIAALDARIYALEHPTQTVESALVLNTSAGQEANFSLVGAAFLTSDGFFTLS